MPISTPGPAQASGFENLKLDQICLQVSSAARPEEEVLASGSWASSGPDDEWGCSEHGAGTPIPHPPCSSTPHSEWALPLG